MQPLRNIDKYIRKGRQLIPARKQLDEGELEALVKGSESEGGRVKLEALAEKTFLFGACVGYDWAMEEQRKGRLPDDLPF